MVFLNYLIHQIIFRHSSQNRAVYPKCFAEIAKTCNFVVENCD